MADGTRLGRHDDVFTDDRRPGNTCLSGDDRPLPDNNVVGDMDQVIDLGSLFDDRRFECCPIDGGVGTDLHVIIDDDVPCSILICSPVLVWA